MLGGNGLGALSGWPPASNIILTETTSLDPSAHFDGVGAKVLY